MILMIYVLEIGKSLILQDFQVCELFEHNHYWYNTNSIDSTNHNHNHRQL